MAFDQNPPGDSLDLTSLWPQVWADAPSAFDAQRDALGRCKIIFVPGMLAKVAIALHWTRLLSYFDDHIAWLQAQGFDPQRLRLNSEAAVETNGEFVAAAIGAADRPVVLIGHSKGGVDTLDALIRFPRLRQKVRAVIALQSPFAGSPIADMVADRRIPRALGYGAARLIRGEDAIVTDLTTSVRRRYHDEHRQAIEAVLRAVPILCLGTRIREHPIPVPETLTGGQFIANLGSAGDGLVPARSACLPGAYWVVLDGLDHAVTIMRSVVAFDEFDRVRLTQTLLALALDQVTRRHEAANPGIDQETASHR